METMVTVDGAPATAPYTSLTDLVAVLDELDVPAATASSR
jgi:hypothetical protein